MLFINLNGQIIQENQPVFGVENRAFRYGDALFETIRVVDGLPCFFDEHLARLQGGMHFLQMDFSEEINFDTLKSQAEKLINANSINEGGRIRITIFRNSGGFYTPDTNEVSYIIEAAPIIQNHFELNKDGLKIDLYEEHKKTINKLSTVKSTNCLTHILAGQYRKAKKLDECVMLNELGSIAECISSNLFVSFNGVLYTPSVNQGVISGIMREQVIQIAHQSNIEVQECPLSPQVLIRADEVFLTNAINGIRWVGAYRTKRYFNKVSKLLTDKLNEKVFSLKMDLLGN